MKTYHIKTFGCQMNYSDSERIASFLESQKLKPTKKIDEAQLVIFNTCGVRQKAEDRIYGQVHNLKKHSPKARMVLTGCLAKRKDVQKRLKNKINLFFPINNFKKFENWIIENSNLKISTQNNSVTDKESIAYLSISPRYSNEFTAFVPIMTGCNNFCAYCVVPHARGREVSRPQEEILEEVRRLIKKGCKEIILLGQNVNSYKDKEINFSKLLKKINDIPGNFWISFMSSHPKDVSDEFIEAVTKLKKVCEYIHLPIQAGSTRIIKKMNRKYTQSQYLKLIEKIKKSFEKNKPGKLYSITSDIIVGFPKETKKDFQESEKVIKNCQFDMVYTAQFSPRPGTAAWEFEDNITKKEKKRREENLVRILKKINLSNNKKYLGKSFDILVDKKKGKYFVGHTRSKKDVRFTSSKNLIGTFQKVKIKKAGTWALEGKLIS